MVQIRFTAAALIAAAVIAPAVANSLYPEDSLATREFADEVDEYFTREYDLDIREFDELVERDPFFRKVKQWWANRKAKKAAAAAGAAEGTVEGREFIDDEELMAREFDEFFQRELEDLMEREPFLGFGKLKKWIKGGNKAAPSGDYSENNAREFEEDIEARDFDEDFEARDFEEDIEARDFEEDIEARDFEEDIEAREYEEVLERYFDDLYERELGEEIEVLERDFTGEELAEREFDSDLFEREDADELVAREPFNIKQWWNNLWHPKKKGDKKHDKKAAAPKPTSTPAATEAAEGSSNEARDFEIDELD